MKRTAQLFRFLLVLAVLRAGLSMLAVPLIPVLYRYDFLYVVLMRPTKEIHMASGFLVRHSELSFLPVALATVPLGLLGVWHLYFLGRTFGKRLVHGDVPRWAARFLPPEKIEQTQATLERRGAGVVFLGRLAVFPSSVIGAAAGSCGVSPRRFLAADTAGAVVSLGAMLGAGYLLNYTYAEIGLWLTVIGVAAVVGMAYLLGRYLKADRTAAASASLT